MNNTGILKTIIDKYELSVPIPPEVRVASEKMKKNILKNILKKRSAYTLFVAAVVWLFFRVKKYGFSISMGKCAAAVTAAAVITACIITGTTIYAVKMLIFDVPEIRQNIETGNEQNKKNSSIETPVLHYGIAVNMVKMEEAPGDKLHSLTSIMISELQLLKGGFAGISSAALDKYHVSEKVLTVSITKLEGERDAKSGKGGVYRISAKVISSQNSQVLMFASETAPGEEAIPDSIKKVAKKIALLL